MVWAVIPAAGIGRRMQTDIPKQYLALAGRSVIDHTLNCFISHPAIEGVMVVIAENDEHWQHSSFARHERVFTVAGGDKRKDSVLNALRELLARGVAGETLVLVHDAARPCVARDEIDRIIVAGTENADGALLALPVADTLKRGVDGVAVETINRDGLWRALTPQAFRLSALHSALQACNEAGLRITDEAAAMEAQGAQPVLVTGHPSNRKITQPEDVALAEAWLSRSSVMGSIH